MTILISFLSLFSFGRVKRSIEIKSSSGEIKELEQSHKSSELVAAADTFIIQGLPN